MFTLTSVLFLHNKWQQNEHHTHLYDSSLWKYSTHQTCFAMYQSTKNIYNCNCENREKHKRKHKSPICCICAWKSAYCVRTKERGGHQREGWTTESDGDLYSVGETLSKHKGIGIRPEEIQYGVWNESCLKTIWKWTSHCITKISQFDYKDPFQQTPKTQKWPLWFYSSWQQINISWLNG